MTRALTPDGDEPPLARSGIAGKTVDAPLGSALATEIHNPLSSSSIGIADDEHDRVGSGRLAEAIGQCEGPDEAELVAGYWRYVSTEEIAGRAPSDLIAAIASHQELARHRTAGQVNLRVHTPDGGVAGGHSMVEIVTDDMPFLVDSVTAELTRHDIGVHLLVHPQLVVRRKAMGEFVDVCRSLDSDEETLAPGETVESWMHVEIDRQPDQDALDALRKDLYRVLTDVREAVEDWQKMRGRALQVADELTDAVLPVPDKDVSDARELLRWLADDHFTFLGYRDYRLIDGPDGQQLQAVLSTGLGILRGDPGPPRNLAQMAPEVRAKALERRLLIVTKANSRSTVHRPAYLDYIGIKTFDSDGRVTGERRFLGLLSSAAYLESVRNLPVISRKVADVIERSGLSPRSHSGKDLASILETYPRDELFQITTTELLEISMAVLRLGGRRQLRLFLRRDAYGRFISCLVYLPRDRYNTRNRLKMQEILMTALHGIGVEYTARVTESVLARVKFIVRTDPTVTVPDLDTRALQEKMAEATRSWDDDFASAIREEIGETHASSLLRRYGVAFPEGYKAEHSAEQAVKDLARIEMLEEPGQLGMHLYRTAEDNLRFTLYRLGEPMSLSALLPVLHSLGVSVVDERPYQVNRVDGPPTRVYDFGLTLAPGIADTEIAIESVHTAVENAFAACWRGESEVDGLNALVLRAGLSWDDVVVLRAYVKYLRQSGTLYSQEYMERAFVAHPDIATTLVELFTVRFDPTFTADPQLRAERADELVDGIRASLDDVASLDEDRILRSFLTMILATLRTNHFQRGAGGRHKQYLSLKIDPQSVPELPMPRPKYEIFVYSPRFEGVHLRFGAVARGGLRWSDRREDFRTEILGLVKAQMVKNTVIVPVGSKGGFVVKKPPAGGDRDAIQAEGIACYRTFISGLLDITDNLVKGEVVPPSDVVRHDGDDPYLVVAADKGTATFSDIANEVAKSYGFWLGDAFASGGSVGYDHKGMGITARGAWESVKRHFRELAHDTQTADFTVVGVGDMSGDVFGNGMLLSEHIRLVAAFDHRHIFVDPNPDAARSFVERRRLFDVPRSSWDNYERSLISDGGGVWPRTAKSIPISVPMRAALGLDDQVSALSPTDLIKSILLAPVDLLWNGGIGTYVKARTESHADVGDKTNDPVRVNGRDLRAKVVGEGGNLGLTQLGRIEAALSGVKINTDAIDNSAGVDTSDHEVNIKILLDQAVTAGTMDTETRNRLLGSMTDEVGHLVLRDNYEQNVALSLSRHLSTRLFSVHRRMMSEMERTGRLDRSLEFLPDQSACDERAAAGKGLTSPELSVLLAYVKIGLSAGLVKTDLPDESWCAPLLVNYFPTPLRDTMREAMDTHALRREIITTAVVNDVVNHGGVSFVFRAIEETGASVADVVRAYSVIAEVFGLRRLWADVEAADIAGDLPSSVQIELLSEVRRVLDRGVRWLLQSRSRAIDVEAEIAELKPGVSTLLPAVPELFVGREAESITAAIEAMISRGAPPDLARRTVCVLDGFGLLDIVELTRRTGLPHREVAEVYYSVSERFHIDEMLDRISLLPRGDRWHALARMALRYDLYAALAALTKEVLQSSAAQLTPSERVNQWAAENSTNIVRAMSTLEQLADEAPADLATLSVVLRQIRTVVRASAGSNR